MGTDIREEPCGIKLHARPLGGKKQKQSVTKPSLYYSTKIAARKQKLNIEGSKNVAIVFIYTGRAF